MPSHRTEAGSAPGSPSGSLGSGSCACRTPGEARRPSTPGGRTCPRAEQRQGAVASEVRGHDRGCADQCGGREAHQSCGEAEGDDDADRMAHRSARGCRVGCGAQLHGNVRQARRSQHDGDHQADEVERALQFAAVCVAEAGTRIAGGPAAACAAASISTAAFQWRRGSSTAARQGRAGGVRCACGQPAMPWVFLAMWKAPVSGTMWICRRGATARSSIARKRTDVAASMRMRRPHTRWASGRSPSYANGLNRS